MKTKMNVKRLLAVSLAAMMTATAFAGCGNSGGSSSDSKADSAWKNQFCIYLKMVW